MLAMIGVAVPTFSPRFGLYPFKVDDILEKSRNRKNEKFEGWILGLYLEHFVVYENCGIKNMVQTNRIKNFDYFSASIQIITPEQFNQIRDQFFTRYYYSSYPEPYWEE